PRAGVLLQGVEAGVKAAAQVDDGPDPAVLPGGQLVRPRLVGAHQLVGDPVGVLEAEPQVGVVVPEVVRIGLEPPALGGEIEYGLGWRKRHGAPSKGSAASTEAVAP